ncbi:hypothetical protein [Roseibium sp.]|uniref:hypothetical protein n=1 Tax=Roseibium sp. TaxID=1936156 RepID=UPI00327C5135
MITTFNGLRIHADPSLEDAIEDWSMVRSPSRAKRRRKRGFPQRIKIRMVPKKDVYQFGRCLIMHPEMVRELERRIDAIGAA